MTRADPEPEPDADHSDIAFADLLEDSTEDLYDHAPCGYLSTLLDGTIVKINQTLLAWLGYRREQLVGRRRFSDLLTVGGRLYHETHFAPLLNMQGEIGGVALELRTAGNDRLPVLVTSTVKTTPDGQPLLIRTTIFDARDRRAYEQELLRARQTAEHEREQLRRLATTLQRSLLPPILPTVPGLDSAAYFHAAAAEEVSGDFYDLFALSDGRWGFFLGDVCGKGPEAAAITSLTRYTLRAAAVYNDDPVAVLTNLNTVLRQENQGADPRYCTVIFGVLTPTSAGYTAVMASGGHPPALLCRADGTATYLNTPGGMLAGVMPDAQFVAITIDLAPGDTLLLYTDGLTESRLNGSDTRYGEAALLALGTRQAPTNSSALTHAIAELLGTFGDGMDDDAALLALSVRPREQ